MPRQFTRLPSMTLNPTNDPEPAMSQQQPPTTNSSDLDTDRRNIVTRLVDIQARIADLNAEAEALKAELRELPPGDYHIDGRPALRVAATRRFNADKALEYVPEPLRDACYTTVVDPKKVKEYLAPALAEACMDTVGKPRITVL